MTDTDKFAGSSAEALLEVHIEWIAARLRLGDVISAKSVQQTAIDNAADMKAGGAIPALVCDIAVAIYEHPIHGETTLEELLPDREFEKLLDKLMEMRQLRDALIHQSVPNPVFANLASQLLYSGLRGYVPQSKQFAARVPGARTGMKIGRAVVDCAPPRISDALERGIRRYVDRNTEAGMRASDAYLHGAFESDELRRTLLD